MESTRTAARILRVLPRERITRALGRLTAARVPHAVLDPVLRLYARAYRVDLDEALLPLGDFDTFNAFFTRRLRPGMRPIDPGAASVASPADGRLDDVGPIDPARAFLVKGQRYDCASLLGSADDAARYAGGAFAVVYLSPRDYHRVHAPVAGVVRAVRHIPGRLFPVNATGVKHVPQLFATNERVVTFLRSETFGEVAVVMVGAMIVGKIELAFPAPPRPPHGGVVAERRYADGDAPRLAKGDELGAFLLGSTVVLLLQRPAAGAIVWDADLTGGAVRVGQAIAQRSGE